ncbi:hypothetical protein MMC12_003503 [Toensbergia leucococca]|nr:hypothetical protein [Toensbergia leucococca]
MTAVAKKEKQLNKVTPTFQSLEAATLEALDYLYGEPIEDISCETIFNPHYTAQRHKILKSCDIWNVVILCQSLQRICTELSDELANDPSALDDNTKGTFEKNLGKTIDTLMRFSPLLLLALADSSVSLADGTRNSAFWTSEKVENGARLLDALKRLKLFIIKYQASQDKSTGQSVEAHRSSKSRIFSSTADSTYSNVDNSGTTLSSLQRDLSKSCFDFRDAFDKELREFSTSNPYGVDLGDETTLGVTRSYFQKYIKDVNRRWSSSYEASRSSDETDDGTKKVSVEQIDNLLYQWLLSVLGFNYSTGTLRQLSKDLWFKDPLPPPPPPPLLQSLFPTATNYLMPQLSQPSLQNSHIYNPYGYNAATFDEQVAQLGLTSPYTVRQASSSYGNQPAMISNPQQATPQNPFGYQSLSPTFQGYSGYVQQNQAIPSMQSQSFSQPSQITHPVPAMNRTQSPAPPSLQPSRPTSQTPDQTGGALSAADHSPSSLPPLAPLPSLSPLPPLPQAPT